MSPLEFQPTARWRRAHAAAELIEDARTLTVPKLAQREAARRAGITPTYWPVIIRGWRLSGGVQAPVTAPDDTLLRMARAVNVEAAVRAVLDDPDAPTDGEPTPADLECLPDADLVAWGEELARRYPEDEAIRQTVRLLTTLAHGAQSKKTG